MPDHKVVSKEEWLNKRIEFLAKEKELTHLRERLAKERQELPWVKIDKQYVFDGPSGKETLADLFAGKSQLIVYHFMFQPDWSEGCKSCSVIADNFEPLIIHLNHRDTNLVAISRAEITKLEAFKKRMGWTFKLLSAHDSDFNFDFNVSFDNLKEVSYNYQTIPNFPSNEGPGISVFFKDTDGSIYHTYSSYSRGLEPFMGIYDFLDIVPKGRDEKGFVYDTEWLRHKDKYGDESFKDIFVEIFSTRSKSDK